MRNIRLGLIGLGTVGQLHLKHALKLNNTDVVAVADSAKSALENAKSLGVKCTYSDYKRLLENPEVDGVLISLPTHLHLECAKQAAEAHKDIFLEKPIAVTVDEAKEVVLAAQRNSVKLMIGYPMRFNKNFIKLKEDLANGLIGAVENAHAVYVCAGPFVHRADGHSPVPVPDWWFDAQLTGGGVLVDLGCHIINLMRWLLGEIVDIKGQFGYRYNMGFEDSAMVLARFSSGSLAAINVGWYSQEYILRLDLLGSVRHVSAEHMPPPTATALYQMLTKGISSFNQPHFYELQYFVDCLQNDVVPVTSGLDGLRDLEAISKAYKNRINL